MSTKPTESTESASSAPPIDITTALHPTKLQALSEQELFALGNELHRVWRLVGKEQTRRAHEKAEAARKIVEAAEAGDPAAKDLLEKFSKKA